MDEISNVELVGAEELGLILAIGEDGKCSLSGKPKAVSYTHLVDEAEKTLLKAIKAQAKSFPAGLEALL